MVTLSDYKSEIKIFIPNGLDSFRSDLGIPKATGYTAAHGVGGFILISILTKFRHLLIVRILNMLNMT